MVELRRLTPLGEAKFGEYLALLRDGGTEGPPFHLLTDTTTSQACDVQIAISSPKFEHRYEFGAWLFAELEALDATLVSRDHGMWSWLGLFFFDQTCPKRDDGTRRPGENARHILPSSYNYRKYYRHLAREAWLAVRMNGDLVKPLLAGGLDRRGDLLEQLSSRIELFGNATIMSAAVQLYVASSGKPTKLASGKSGGSPRRLATIVKQLKLTYDLRGSSGKQLLTLLPAEEFSAI